MDWKDQELFEGREREITEWGIMGRELWWKDSASSSQDHFNDVPRTEWLQTTEMCWLTVLEARNLESRCWQGHTLSGGSTGETFLASSGFWCLPNILGAPWLVHESLQLRGCPLPVPSLHPPSVGVCLCVLISPFHKGWTRACPKDLILLSYFCKTLFPNKATFWATKG